MAKTTGIEWTDSTFNPWIGCTKIAPACDHCYAAALDKRMGAVTHWGDVPRRRTGEHYWHEPLRWQRKAAEFFAEHGRRQRVFCASMADVFDNQIDPAWRIDLWELIRQTPDLDWQLLTKRPQNIRKMLPLAWGEIRGHVWLGTTIEDQDHADQNLPHLLQHDSAVRFVSCEPLLGPIDIKRSALDWIIAGGESGGGARPSDPNWFRSLRDQAAYAGVPFFFKQWGDWREGERIGKKLAGSLLDGVPFKQFPQAAA